MEEVEKFRITPEMRAFMKTYNAYNKVSERLRKRLEIHLDEASRTKQMLEQVEKGVQMLMLNAPEKPTFEVSGQEEDFDPRIQF